MTSKVLDRLYSHLEIKEEEQGLRILSAREPLSSGYHPRPQ